jgi:hypothetical protein
MAKYLRLSLASNNRDILVNMDHVTHVLQEEGGAMLFFAPRDEEAITVTQSLADLTTALAPTNA